MFLVAQNLRCRILKKITIMCIGISFLASYVMPAPLTQAQAVPALIGIEGLCLPALGTMVSVSSDFNPPIITGVILDNSNPFKLDFVIDKGDEELTSSQVQQESKKLIDYFMAALTVPENEMWVNLSPYEENRIIADGLARTEMGGVMLAQDYLLKQLMASLMYPEGEAGEQLWEKIYASAREQGVSDVPINTFNKVWIIPEKAEIYVNGGNVFVVNSRLKVMLEEDYLALKEDESRAQSEMSGTSQLASDVIKEVIIPVIEKEVNNGKNFANLRQIYNSMILATWYKNNLKESIMSEAYLDKNKTRGIEIADKEIKQKIYNQYIIAFKNGVYDYIKEEYDPMTQEIIPRKYFSGGKDFAMLSGTVRKIASKVLPKRWIEKMSKRPLIVVESEGGIIVEESMNAGVVIEDEARDTVNFTQLRINVLSEQSIDVRYARGDIVVSGKEEVLRIKKQGEEFVLVSKDEKIALNENESLLRDINGYSFKINLNGKDVLIENLSQNVNIYVDYLVEIAKKGFMQKWTGFKSVEINEETFPHSIGKRVRITEKDYDGKHKVFIGKLKKFVWTEANSYDPEGIVVDLDINGNNEHLWFERGKRLVKVEVEAGLDDIPALASLKTDIVDVSKGKARLDMAVNIIKLVDEGKIPKGAINDPDIIKKLIQNTQYTSKDISVNQKINQIKKTVDLLTNKVSGAWEWYTDDEMFEPPGVSRTQLVYQLNSLMGMPIEKYVLDHEFRVDADLMAGDLKSGNSLVRTRAATLAGYAMAFPGVLRADFVNNLVPLLQDENEIVRIAAARSIERVFPVLDYASRYMSEEKYFMVKRYIEEIRSSAFTRNEKDVIEEFGVFVESVVDEKLLKAEDVSFISYVPFVMQNYIDNQEFMKKIDGLLRGLEYSGVDFFPVAKSVFMEPIPPQEEDRKRGKTNVGAIIFAIKLLKLSNNPDVPELLAMGLGHPNSIVREEAADAFLEWSKKQSLDDALDASEVLKRGMLEVMSMTYLKLSIRMIEILAAQVHRLSTISEEVSVGTMNRMRDIFRVRHKDSIPVTALNFKSVKVAASDLEVQKQSMETLSVLLESGVVDPMFLNEVVTDGDMTFLNWKKKNETGSLKVGLTKKFDMETPAKRLIKNIIAYSKTYNQGGISKSLSAVAAYSIDEYGFLKGNILEPEFREKEMNNPGKTIAVGLSILGQFNPSTGVYDINELMLDQLRKLHDEFGYRLVLWSGHDGSLVKDNFIQDFPEITKMFDLIVTPENNTKLDEEELRSVYLSIGLRDEDPEGNERGAEGFNGYSILEDYLLSERSGNFTFLGYSAFISTHPNPPMFDKYSNQIKDKTFLYEVKHDGTLKVSGAIESEMSVDMSFADNIHKHLNGSQKDTAMIGGDRYGGIDLNAEHLKINESGKGFDFSFRHFNMNGIDPSLVQGVNQVITNITPIINFYQFLGMY